MNPFTIKMFNIYMSSYEQKKNTCGNIFAPEFYKIRQDGGFS